MQEVNHGLRNGGAAGAVPVVNPGGESLLKLELAVGREVPFPDQQKCTGRPFSMAAKGEGVGPFWPKTQAFVSAGQGHRLRSRAMKPLVKKGGGQTNLLRRARIDVKWPGKPRGTPPKTSGGGGMEEGKIC